MTNPFRTAAKRDEPAAPHGFNAREARAQTDATEKAKRERLAAIKARESAQSFWTKKVEPQIQWSAKNGDCKYIISPSELPTEFRDSIEAIAKSLGYSIQRTSSGWITVSW